MAKYKIERVQRGVVEFNGKSYPNFVYVVIDTTGKEVHSNHNIVNADKWAKRH